MLLFENDIGMDGTIEQLQQIVFLQRFEHIELTTGKQRTYDLEGGILGGGTYQCNHTPLDGSQQ